ncbi:helix-turn-helix domain-containing protein [Pseudomonas petrae]|uniref:Helix-turn-helix domain-containing protein n=1 Tax=Pseudomonas petrae TaxID=2912190 RepID=A0ABS9IAI9_9PSED|nr:helix-turn-helix transcriptional regulator [Pseudomonas petrae]MCF7535251.1 helix-turn-helix domain-containing protein [Pseudomonas petrae]MCF7540423.1 helix-turn-helix domain-containing protein [Pseudomonas petrae]MCF7544427.1 helix-turn-helix domain-containing protein [Pseudomonas petrae]MCF7558517.1 helix-turn-helix domain-containing protein [Pseudomonas petrae]
MNGIGKRLRQERKRLKLTQSALGAIGGVEANAQGHYESGQRLPRADYLFKIAAAGVDITRVVTGVDASARAELPSFPTMQTTREMESEADLDNSESMVKIISQLRQSLWITANALREVTRLVDSEEPRSSVDHVEDHLKVLQGDADMFAALALAKVQKAAHETH